VDRREKTGLLLVKSIDRDKYSDRFIGDIIWENGGVEVRLSEFLLKHKLAKPYTGGRKQKWTDEELQAIVDAAAKTRELLDLPERTD
jgi:hypothetical protein